MPDIKLNRHDWMVVVATSIAGTLFCVFFALAFDYTHFMTLPAQERAIAIRNNIVIPSILAPFFFGFLTHKIRQLEIARHRLEELASIDSLTKVLNRRAFTERVSRGLEGLEGAAMTKGALLVIDVDHFKAVNDNFGHDHGDVALTKITEAIASIVRQNDLVGRLGGEEFGVFIPWIDRETARIVAERICAMVQSIDFAPVGAPHMLSVSIGIAMSDGRSTLVSLYKIADQALYAAKRAGRNRYVEGPVEILAA